MNELREAAAPAGTDLLDERTRELADYCAAMAGRLRAIGMRLDQDPDVITEFLHAPEVRFPVQGMLPPEYRSVGEFPARLVEVSSTVLGQVVATEQVSYGDPNVLLASPGPSLSGGAVQALADEQQRKRYFGRLASNPTHTFFALTEPGKGSAATELETTLTPAPGGGWLLNGVKCYIGNGARAQLGVVFCRRAPGPWGIEAVLLDTSAPGFSGELLPTVGLRGARISRLRFQDVTVADEDVLGAQRSPSRRGLYGATYILYRFRPGIAAMAIGCAQAACDYLVTHRPTLPRRDRHRLDNILDRIAAVRHRTYAVASDIDAGVIDVAGIGAVKARAARVAEDATRLVAELLGPACLIEHPWVEKTYRDVRAFELMEGTTNLHAMSVFQRLLRDRAAQRPVTERAVDGAARH
ncbi:MULTISPECIES: acyl-CoA dehydrogenase family protein [unclassified Micromonospora]|uniref:acyl-CoA dehydrogenase family protein n=1 Tax=unclassified Micromonospora TaxID=2617518 RepID=UPI0022B6E7AD|nr:MULTISPECIES: acyl-CoA dehydrogenase family protein [unclassified Micromonospora]MCZ7422221.1 acyl-CoA/acyl-ACP dehydrogenase [Verrucosispora sp. WMMA2121]WBB89982.1 acyl-CoA/acyl-ACP dehydrogenase [Verrucosispora sp. WMMC514]